MDLRVSVAKRFGPFDLQVDFAVSQDRVGVFGPSGSGKSTLVALIAGLQQPDEGTIRLDGETLYGAGCNKAPEQRRIGIIFQHPHLFPHLSVRGNLLYGHRRCAADNRRIDFDSLVEVLQIGHLLERGVNRLSGGEKQRVAIGRAVLSNPRLLLMDEPLSALDDSLRFQIIRHLKTVCEAFRIPYLFISHSLLEMRLMSDSVLVFERGALVTQASGEQLARTRMGQSPVGYINILTVSLLCRSEGLYSYQWGHNELFISAGNDRQEAMFELSSKDIILFKRHPEAISARNLLAGTVVDIFNSDGRVGVELLCGGERLIAEVVDQAAEELGIVIGCELYAAVKASAFRRLN
ncbi:molybdenum ABC transporter ATP-binding protein [Geobacter sp. SVR]|uniref:molybdenum ABC transporter ATP-binding protein n=1 Tax=Geobacter sp. SVR TaxID=2495594 RepID=UPI00143EF582|nr:molybdenum ABC transporter ATP-binding protein [Geobacter sp. SVR]BCS55281.1 molybdate-transporting ATPase [Geobacter sp. SVR]GCF86080.1 molybdate-transporting ATPase [Geobacter sp. SVR]